MCVEQSGTSRPGAEVKDRISLVVVERGLGGHIAVDNTELGTGRALQQQSGTSRPGAEVK